MKNRSNSNRKSRWSFFNRFQTFSEQFWSSKPCFVAIEQWNEKKQVILMLLSMFQWKNYRKSDENTKFSRRRTEILRCLAFSINSHAFSTISLISNYLKISHNKKIFVKPIFSQFSQKILIFLFIFNFFSYFYIKSYDLYQFFGYF